MNNNVLIYKTKPTYPDGEYSFSPSEKYPEYPFSEIAGDRNDVYDAVREGLRLYGLDSENYGKESWNPLGAYIKPGDTVLIKPNLVREFNRIRENGMLCVITHPSVIRALSDYALIALKGAGKLVIGDAPIQQCDFEKLVSEQKIDRIMEFYNKHSCGTIVELRDFRNFKSYYENGAYHEVKNESCNGIFVDLGKDSSFGDIPDERYKRLRITNYPKDIMLRHHTPEKNEYLISTYMLGADVVINLCKPKTHRFAGVTIALKNMIGINANKELLPHHSTGSRQEHGDESDKKSFVKALFSKLDDTRNKKNRQKQYFAARVCHFLEFNVLEKIIKAFYKDANELFGMGHKNDTIWRTIIDINKIVFFADKQGRLHDTPQRKMLVVGDMIVSGHESGPLMPAPKDVGVIAIGENPVCFDEAICSYMGFDFNKIPTIANAAKINGKYSFGASAEPVIISNLPKLNNKKLSELRPEDVQNFTPHPAWKDFLQADSLVANVEKNR